MLAICVAVVSGLPAILYSKEEYDGYNLWVPNTSDYYKNVNWLRDNGHPHVNPSAVILASENENVLTLDYLKTLLRAHHILRTTNTSEGITFLDVCSKTSSINGDIVCMENSLLELWASNGTYNYLDHAINQIKNDFEIINGINIRSNETILSRIFGTPIYLDMFIGNMEIQESLITAEALRLVFVLEINSSNYDESLKTVSNFEEAFMLQLSSLQLPPGLKVGFKYYLKCYCSKNKYMCIILFPLNRFII